MVVVVVGVAELSGDRCLLFSYCCVCEFVSVSCGYGGCTVLVGRDIM